MSGAFYLFKKTNAGLLDPLKFYACDYFLSLIVFPKVKII